MPAPSPLLRSSASESFGTRYAHFEAANFSELPGWRDDKVVEAWQAFRHSCVSLGKRPAWTQLCARAAKIRPPTDEVIRQFFEQEFKLLQVMAVNRTPQGIITGYFEPLLSGSRAYGDRYRYPVYASPDDMLYLDAARLPTPYRSQPVQAHVQGKRVIPILPGTPLPPRSTSPYTLDLRGMKPDITQQKWRLRLQGTSILPYYSRAEIESSRLRGARAILWVDDAYALYSMQIQGCGRVRLSDGTIVRLAYAEQNGHPFIPAVQMLARRTRGIDDQLQILPTRGLFGTDGSTTGLDLAQLGLEDEPASEHTTPRLRGVPSSSPTVRSDPSYIFFREAPNTPDGPVGAFGVPLTPGRSVAVDPRPLPLGYPLFISTARSERVDGMSRLVLAQDTGGAIRGAVRADYFWGFGPTAAQLASRMKQSGRVWLLVPKEQNIAMGSSGVLTRGGSSGATLRNCVVPDPEFCVDDE
jgi:membrane-bound lytic murein transglycosylase A